MLAAGHAHAQAPQLFAPAEPSESVSAGPLASEVAQPGGATVRARTVRMDFDLVARQFAVREQVPRLEPDDAPPATFTLNLFDDAVYEVVGLRTAPTSGGYSLSGQLEGVPFGDVTIVVNGDVVAGAVNTPTATYTIRSTQDGGIEIRETDPSTLPALGEPIPAQAPVPNEDDAEQPNEGAAEKKPLGTAATAASEQPTTIDVLVVYTGLAKRVAGGLARIEAHIDLLLAITNKAYVDSGVKQRVNLVGTKEVPDQGTDATEALYRLQRTSDGHLDDVHTLRDALGADIVMMVDAIFQYCGLAFLNLTIGPSNDVFAFGRVMYGCGTSFAHELGHIMGLSHDRYQERSGPPSNRPHPWSYGYVNQAFKWRTIMSYVTQCADKGVWCPLIARFSNAEQSYGGDPLGVAGGKPTPAVDGPADARRTLNITRTSVAAFRSTAGVSGATARRLTPPREKTNADTLTWRVAFAPRGANNVDASDFVLVGTKLGAPTLSVAAVGTDKRSWNVTASGGNLASLDGTVTLEFAAGHDIEDPDGAAVSSKWIVGSERTYALENVRPRVSSWARHDPASASTNADALTWRVVFDEDVVGVDAADFEVRGTTAALAVAGGGSTIDVTASGGDLADLVGSVTLGFAAAQNIEDAFGNALVATLPAAAETSYSVNNPRRPAQVTGVSLQAGIESLRISWSPVADAAGYKVQWRLRTQAQYASGDQATLRGSVTSYVIDGLSDLAEYAVRVIATKAGADDGPPSVEVSGRPLDIDLGQVTGVALRAGIESLQVSWSSVPDATGYRVQWRLKTQARYAASDQAALQGSVGSYVIDGLTGGAEYIVRVIATRAGTADGPPSADVSGRPRGGSLAQVTGVSLRAGVASLQVSWNPVPDATGYKVQWRLKKRAQYAAGDAATMQGSVTSYVIGGLSDDEEYTVRVIARKAGADDAAPSVEVSGKPRGGNVALEAVDSSVTEGAGIALRVTLSGPAAYDVSIPVSVTETAAMLTASPSASFEVATGDRSALLSVATTDDAVVESDSKVTGSLSSVPGYRVSTRTVDVWVRDNDAATFAVSAAPAEIEEGGSSTVTVAIANGVTFAEDQSIALAASGAAVAADYALSATALTLDAGEASVTATLTAVDDPDEEEAETVVVSASHNDSPIGSATVTIAANDVPSDDASLKSLTLSGVDIGTFSAGTAGYAAEVDNDVTGTTVTAQPNDAGARVSIADADGTTAGTSRDVSLAVGDNVVTVTVTAADGETTQSYTVTVTRALAPLTASFEGMPAPHTGETFSFRVRFSAAIATSYKRVRDRAFDVTGGAVTGASRVNGSNSLWRIEVTPSGEADVTIVLAADRKCSLGVCTKDGRRLSNRVEATVAGPTWPEASIRADAASVAEGAAAAFTVTLAEAASADVTVAVDVSETGSVLAASTPASVTVPANETSATVSLATDDDTEVEANGAVTVALSSGTGYTVGSPDSAEVTVTDNDTATFAVAAQPASIDEGGSSTVTARVSNGVTFAADQTIALSTTGSAAADDFTLATTLTLDAGESSVTAALMAVDDDLEESGETVVVEASHDGSPIGSATVTIVANDAPSDDATLRSLTLTDVDIGTFAPGTASYAGRAAHDVAQTTVSAAANDSGASVSIADADGTTAGTSRTVSLAAGDNVVTVTVTAADGVTTNAYTVTVTREQPPLTASFEEMPASHTGEAFGFRVRFSAAIATSYKRVRDKAFMVTDGAVTGASRVNGSNSLWRIEVTPTGEADVTVVLRANRKCSRGICTGDGRRLSTRLEATVTGPATASATVAGSVLTLTWPTPRDRFAPPDGSDFAVLADGDWVTVTDARLSGRRAVLTLSTPVLPEQAVSVDYLGSAMHPLQGAAGGRVPAWLDLAVVNLTGLESQRLDPPELETGAWVAALLPHGGTTDASLSLAGRGLTGGSVAALVASGGLRRLDLSANRLTGLSALSGLRELESLDLSDNALSDIGPLASLVSLRRLDLRGNGVADVWPLAELPRLEVLLLDGNAVSDIGPLTHLGRLENLGLADNPVTDLAPLADLWSLRRLDVGGSPAANLTPLGDLNTLVWLRVAGPADAAPVHRLARLRWLRSVDGGIRIRDPR